MTTDDGRRCRKTCAILAAGMLLAGSRAGAHLCATDPVPAATLLYFVTGQYAGTSTPTNPVADRTAPRTTFSVTNVTAAPRVVNLVLHNDFGVPLLGWNALLTGYDVVTFDFADILEGYITPSGPATNPATSRPWSPVGTTPDPTGPLETFGPVPPSLAAPTGPGTTANTTSSIFGLCTNPTYTTPFTVDPGNYATRIPPYNRSYVYNGLRKSGSISENGWWGNRAPNFVPPDWLLDWNTSGPVLGYVTVDVTAGCAFSFPTTTGYFMSQAIPRTVDYYDGNPATGRLVDLGNSILGDWRLSGGPAGSEMFARSGHAVSIEADNQDVTNSVQYPKAIGNGASFYRYSPPVCGPAGQPDDLILCQDFYTGTGTGGDFTSGAPYVFGSASSIPSNDFREPLPSAFAFRWFAGEDSTRIRVWKEFTDLYPYYGYTYVYSFFQYSYYAWDDEEHVFVVSNPCPVPPCEPTPNEINQLPLGIQEVDLSLLQLPTSYLGSGWMLLAMMGANSYLLAVPGGYSGPFPNTYGSQAWVDVIYSDGIRSQEVPASPVGNFLCDGFAVNEGPYGGPDVSGNLY